MIRDERRKAAEADLEVFINLVHPLRYLGNIHKEVIRWWCRSTAKSHQALFLPRGHMKSALVAYRVAWELTRNPTLTVLYISSTINLATKQLKFIKDILTSPNYRIYWPEMVEQEEAKREKWTEKEISVDHPLRKQEAIRDPSIFTAGLTSNIVGMHCDVTVLDDVVVANNAYTEQARDKVKEQYGYLSSIENAGAREWVVGTRYHPRDLYSIFIEGMQKETYDEYGLSDGLASMFEIFQRPVESAGDGTGEFLWPRSKRADGKEFGFDSKILQDKRIAYQVSAHFRAQYYNDPHDISEAPISNFQYYDPQFLIQRGGHWYFNQERLNVFAAVDFAFSLNRKADYTAIVVVGIDGRHNYYVLEIDRFKGDQPSVYFKHILELYQKWGFRRIRAEVTAAQAVLVKDIKESYIKPLGLSLIVEEFRPSVREGSKEERIMATLEPKYANGQMWHYASGNCQLLEEELRFANPSHDDIKDALAAAVDMAADFAPMNVFKYMKDKVSNFDYHGRWGGVV